MSLHTLKGWLKTPSKSGAEVVMPSSLPQSLPAGQWSAPERLLALQESHGLRGEALHAWCREKGLFEHQLTAWREAFVSTPAPQTAQERRESKAELKALQGKHEVLQRELRRKERALAEAAALLVLQKKFQALLGGED
jgi:hypothetical protein